MSPDLKPAGSAIRSSYISVLRTIPCKDFPIVTFLTETDETSARRRAVYRSRAVGDSRPGKSRVHAASLRERRRLHQPVVTCLRALCA